ncbi:MAG: hypothetical protein AAGF71_02285 [Pseudomonadota bacterium]
MATLSAHAETAVFDGSLVYSARHSLLTPSTGGSDNDLFFTTVGASWTWPDRTTTRVGIIAGAASDEDLDRQTGVGGFELLHAWSDPKHRTGAGLRMVWADDLTSTVELGVTHERFGVLADWTDVRLVAGAQFVQDDDLVTRRSAQSAFGLGEASFYPGQNSAVRVAVLGDADGELAILAFEQRLWRLPISFFVEYAETQTDYRGFQGYNDLTGGFRFVPRKRSIKEDSRAGLARTFNRYVSVQ